jgi:hypothetical protein
VENAIVAGLMSRMTEAEHIRALMSEPLRLAPYAADVETTRRVGIALRAHLGPWSRKAQMGVEQSIVDQKDRLALMALYRARSRHSEKMAVLFPDDPEHAADMKRWGNLYISLEAQESSPLAPV